MFFDLRRDINNIFDIPFIGYVDPLEELMDMRRRMIDAFDVYVPEQQPKPTAPGALESGSSSAGALESGTSSSSSSSSGSEKEKEKDEIVARDNRGSGKTIARRGGLGGVRQWVPRCDVHEDEKEYVVHAEVPGMKKEDIKVEFDPETHLMVLSGERKDAREEKKETEKGSYHCVERNYGSFMRSFRVPEQCWTKLDSINAKCTDGILEIHCPKDEKKVEEKKVRSIEIN